MKKWMRITVWTALALGALGAAEQSLAEEVRVTLRNGDVIRGRLISEGSVVLIEHKYLGDVEIPKSGVKAITRPNQTAKKPEQPAAGGEGSPESGSESKTSPPWYVGLAKAMSFEEWSRQFEFGMSSQNGRRDKVDFNARFNMRRKIEKNDYRFEFRRYYGESNQLKTTDRSFSNFRWRRDLSPGVFYQMDTSYSSDAIKEIDLNLEQKVGLGYRFINQKALKVSTGAGMSGRYRDENDEKGITNYLLDVFQDVDYRMNSRVRLTQEFRIALPPDDRNEYEYEFEAAMVSKVTDSLHMSLRYQLEYDKSLPEDRREDQRVVSSIGFDF